MVLDRLLLVASLVSASAPCSRRPPPRCSTPSHRSGRWASPRCGSPSSRVLRVSTAARRRRVPAGRLRRTLQGLPLPSILVVRGAAKRTSAATTAGRSRRRRPRARRAARALLKAGVDYDFQRETRRSSSRSPCHCAAGGLGHGSHVRVDWLPGRGNSWNFGVQIRSSRTWARRGRRDTEVDMPRAREAVPRAPIDPAVVTAMREVRAAARGSPSSARLLAGRQVGPRQVAREHAPADPRVPEAAHPDEAPSARTA